MNQELANQVLQALTYTISPDQSLAQQSEHFLTVEQKSNPHFFTALMGIIINQSVAEQLRMAASLVLKKHIERGFLELPEDVQQLIQTHILLTAYSSGSLKVGKQVIECFFKLLFKVYPEKWPTLESELYTQLTDPALNIDRLYFVLKAYVKVCQMNEWSKVDEKSQFLSTMPAFLAAIAKRTEEILASNSEQKPLFLSIIFKILCKTFRTNNFAYFHDAAVADFWFGTVFRTVFGNYGEMQKPVKWLLRYFVIFFRKADELNKQFSEKVSKKAKEKKVDQIAKLDHDLVKKWQFVFFEHTLHAVSVFTPSTDNQQVITSASRVFIYAASNPDVTNRYHRQILGLLQEKVIPMLCYTESQVDDFQDNPVELLKSLDEFYHEANCRGAALTILTSIGKQPEFLLELLNHVYSQMQLVNSVAPPTPASGWLLKEALYYLTEKLVREIDQMKGADAVVAPLIATQLIPDLQTNFPILKTRVCNLLKVLLTSRLEDQQYSLHFKAIAEQLCRIITDPYLPLKGAAAMTLALFMRVESVVEMIRPHIQTILQIYVNLINECDIEQLIDTLKDICDIFRDQIGPYIVDLISNLCALVIRMYDKKRPMEEQPESDNLEEHVFSILSVYTTIFELLSTAPDSTGFPTIFTALAPTIVRTLEEDEYEDFSECISIVTLMLYKSQPNQVAPELWTFFEFICLTVLKLPELPPNYTNPFQKYILTSQITIGEFGTSLVHLLRNYLHRGLEQMVVQQIAGQTHLDLYLTTLQKLKDEKLGQFAEGSKYFAAALEANVILELATKPDVLAKYGLVSHNITSSINSFAGNMEDSQAISWLSHNIGICFAVDFKTTLESLSKASFGQPLLTFWVQHHKTLFTFRTRKASFLGLLSVLNSTGVANLIAQAGLDETQYLAFLMSEVIAIAKIYEEEVKMYDEDDDDDIPDNEEEDGDGEDEEEDPEADHSKKQPKPFSLLDKIEDLTKDIENINKEHVYELEEMLQFDYEYCEDAFEKCNHVDSFKSIIQRIYGQRQDVYQTALAALGTEGQTKFKEIVEGAQNAKK